MLRSSRTSRPSRRRITATVNTMRMLDMVQAGQTQRILLQRLDIGGAHPTVAVKASIDIAGIVSHCGSAVLSAVPPAVRHAQVVERLIAAGARIVGQANMHELAYGVTGINRWTGTPINPNYPDRIPGGSSSGCAAAVAAGIAAIGIGSDTGGSIRVPAACCGVIGLKPTFGRVSRAGVQPMETSLDCLGPMARDMATIEQAMTLMDPDFTADPLPVDFAIGFVTVDAEPAIGRATADALHSLGADIKATTLPLLADAFNAGLTIIAAETWTAFGHHVDTPGMGEDVRTRLRAAGRISAEQIARAETMRARFSAQVDAALTQVDVLALPTLPIMPPTLEDAANAAAMLRLTALVRPFNLSGHPALTLPLASPWGAPIGLQFVGRRGGDARLCAIGRACEARLRARVEDGLR